MGQSLDQVRVGASVVVTPSGILHEPESVTARRLLHQGILPGTELLVIRRTSGGGRVVGVGRSRIALDPSVIRGIVVTESASPAPDVPLPEAER